MKLLLAAGQDCSQKLGRPFLPHHLQAISFTCKALAAVG